MEGTAGIEGEGARCSGPPGLPGPFDIAPYPTVYSSGTTATVTSAMTSG